jgi:hypothetical protein
VKVPLSLAIHRNLPGLDLQEIDSTQRKTDDDDIVRFLSWPAHTMPAEIRQSNTEETERRFFAAP